MICLIAQRVAQAFVPVLAFFSNVITLCMPSRQSCLPHNERLDQIEDKDKLSFVVADLLLSLYGEMFAV
jgi:hypothetical protein